MTFGSAIRSQWLLEKDITFLNHGSFGACPKKVLEVQRGFQEQMEREPVRFMKREFPAELAKNIAKLSNFVGARPEHLVLVENATMGINAVLRSLMPSFEQGDELLTTSHVYGAVGKTLQYASDCSGATVVQAEVPFPISNAEQIIEALRVKITPKTRLALFDHITSPSGIVFPIKELIAIFKEKGIPVIIDGAHAPGLVDLDLENLGADYYTGNCHKWLFAPKGAAFLWVAPENRSKIHPTVISQDYGASFQEEFAWTGTRDFTPWLSIGAAIDFLNEIGIERSRNYIKPLLIDARKIITEAMGVEYASPIEMLETMVAFPLPGNPKASLKYIDTLHDIIFDEYNIEVPILQVNGHCYLRISVNIYNELSDYQKLADVLPIIFKSGVL